mgnify:FL=1
MKKMTFVFSALFLMTAQFSLAAEPHFFKLELQETSQEEPTNVKLNLPLGMIQAMSPQIQDAIDKGLDEVHVQDQTFNLREVWAEIQAVGAHEYARINGPDGVVVVSTTETHLIVEMNDDEQELRAEIPLSVGDILLGSENPDFEAIVEQLIELEEEYLIVVTGTHINMKAWIE